MTSGLTIRFTVAIVSVIKQCVPSSLASKEVQEFETPPLTDVYVFRFKVSAYYQGSRLNFLYPLVYQCPPSFRHLSCFS